MLSIFLSKAPFPIRKPLLNPFLLFHNISTNNRAFIRLVSPKYYSTDIQHSFTVSYLINSCGLSPESAISISQKVNFEAPHKPDSVLNLFKTYGFTKTQISDLVKRCPVLLLFSPDKTLLPKLEFLKSIGVLGVELTKKLSFNPTVLTWSLDNHIIPCYNQLKSIIGSDKKVVAAFKRISWSFLYDHYRNLLPNIECLRDAGVPNSHIALLLTHFPGAMMQKIGQFVEIVEQVKKLGFDPEKSVFVLAVHTMSGANKMTWERSYDIYATKWGWSKGEIMMAYRKHPHCMMLSEKKLMKGMQYLVDEMGWPANFIAACPQVLFFSLEKRIKPRCSVVQVLNKKGLIKNVSLSTILVPVEDYFLERFVYKYMEEVPQLLSVYQGEIGVSDV